MEHAGGWMVVVVVTTRDMPAACLCALRALPCCMLCVDEFDAGDGSLHAGGAHRALVWFLHMPSLLEMLNVTVTCFCLL